MVFVSRAVQTRRKRDGCYGQEVDQEEGLEEEGQEEGFEEGWKEVCEEEKQEGLEKEVSPVNGRTPSRSARPHRRATSESPHKRALVVSVLGALAFLVALAGCAPRATRGGRDARARLRADIERALGDPALAHSGAGVLVVSLDRGDTLFSRDPDRLFTPASNLKLFTTASALGLLGPDHRFRTPLLATGALRGDTLRGDLVLVGHGDPDLVTADLATLADTVVARGVRVVDGDVRADASWFDDVEWGTGWMWDDGPYWYWPYVSALTLNDNTVTLVVRPGAAPGRPVAIELDPPTAYVRVDSRATTVSGGDAAGLTVTRHWTPVKENVVDVTGTLPAGADSVVEVRTVEDPALYAATVFAELLQARGVDVLGSARRAPLTPGEAVDTLAVHTSDSLAVSVRNFLKVSDNLTGEQLVKTIGAETAGPPGSYPAGIAAERAFLAREAGIDTTAFVLADGSGVSRYNLVTPGQIVRVLRFLAGRDDLAPAFLPALPVAGVDGTLGDRMKGTPAEGRARAKTGTLSGVTALSGYVPSADGERIAFSLLFEFFDGSSAPRRAVQDSIVAALARFRR